MDIKTVNHNFRYHKPDDAQARYYSQIRTSAHELALVIMQYCPDSRERSLAMTNLEQCVMWANASIARSER